MSNIQNLLNSAISGMKSTSTGSEDDKIKKMTETAMQAEVEIEKERTERLRLFTECYKAARTSEEAEYFYEKIKDF